jgi:hypothetical protein
MQLSSIFVEKTTGDILFPHIMITGLIRTSGFTVSRIITDIDRRFAIKA